MRPVLKRGTGLGPSVRSITKRFGWGVADQALSSLTNFGLGLFAARSLSPAEFGVFALVFAGYLLALGTARAVTSEPFAVRHAAVSRSEWHGGAAAATGAAFLVGVLAGVGCAVVSLFVEGSLRTGFLALGATLPGLLLQDTWRFTFFAARKGASAFTNDMVWAVSLFGALVIVLLGGLRSAGWLVLAWGSAGTVAGLFGVLQSSTLPAPGRTLGWIRQQRDLIPRYLGEFSVTTVVGQVTTFALGGIAGLTEVGSLRAGQILLGPLNVLFLGVNIVAVPEGVRALLLSSKRLLDACRGLSAFFAACALVVGGLVWSLPDHIGSMLLRDNWAGARLVVVPLALGMALSGVVLGAGVGLRSLAAARLSLRAKLMTAPLSLLGGIGGAAVAGAIGAAWGMALALAVGVVIWWRYFILGLRQHVQASTVPEMADALLHEPIAPTSTGETLA